MNCWTGDKRMGYRFKDKSTGFIALDERVYVFSNYVIGILLIAL